MVNGCSCQRAENVEAKKRLQAPPPKSRIDTLAAEKLAVSGMAKDKAMQERVNRMTFSEVAKRVGSAQLTSKGKLDFDRAGFTVHSAEDNLVVQTADGDFSVVNVTSDGSRQELLFANKIFFLKNNNGQWRISRDPSGEALKLRDKSGGVWRSFYELFAHALMFSAKGLETVQGREAYHFVMTVTDKSAEALQMGKDDPFPAVRQEVVQDGGVTEVIEKRPETMKRLAAWRERSRAKSGGGDVWVDADTGVVLKVAFKGELTVGDEATAATLKVDIQSELTDIGKELKVEPPKEATREVARVKLPVKPGQSLVKAGVMKETPKEEPKKKTQKKPEKSGTAKAGKEGEGK